MHHTALHSQSKIFIVQLSLLVLLLSLFTVYMQYQKLGTEYITSGMQQKRQREVLEGVAGNPWQYRVLSHYVVEVLTKSLKIAGLKRRARRLYAAIGLRFAQNFSIFLLAFFLFQQLGLSKVSALLTLPILGWSFVGANYDSDLQWSTYSDIFFYLISTMCILGNRFTVIPALTLLAALNRETSGFIPLLASYYAFFVFPERKNKVCAILSVMLYILTFVTLRLSFPEQKFIDAYGHKPGVDMIHYNVSRIVTWQNILQTFSVIPIIALIKYRGWCRDLKRLFWIIVPAWTLTHLTCAVLAETRLLLTPFFLVLLPAAFVADDTRST